MRHPGSTDPGSTDPVSTDLDLPDQEAASLARLVEDAQRATGRIRYGSVFRVGTATVVLNPDSPLTTANFAATVTGDPDAVVRTLRALPSVFAEAGRREVVLVASPASLPEIDAVAEDCGYVAVEEGVVLVAAGLAVPAPPGPDSAGVGTVVPLRDGDEEVAAALLAEAYGLPTRSLLRHVTQRLDDPRVTALASPGGAAQGRPRALALAFTERPGGLALVTDLAVATRHRHHGRGRTLAAAITAALRAQGAALVVTACEAGGRLERFWTAQGFRVAYATTTFTVPTQP